MLPKKDLAVLVLAAGQSSRMGKPKQLLPWKGTTLINHSLDQLKGVSQHNYVVLGSNYDQIAPEIGGDWNILNNLNWRQGMGSSVSFGIHSISKLEEVKGVLICLVDQPLIDKELYLEMISFFEKNTPDAVALSYRGRAGVPALIHKKHFQELLKLGADSGAKQLLQNQNLNVMLIKRPMVLIDIDTPEQYHKLFGEFGQSHT